MENEVPTMNEEEQAPVTEIIVEVSHEEKLWAMGCHLIALAGYAIPIGTDSAPTNSPCYYRVQVEIP